MRVYKQVEERLNRTYKQNYHGTNGYSSLRNANIYMFPSITFYVPIQFLNIRLQMSKIV